MVTCSILVRPYLARWAERHYGRGGVVVFEDRLNVYHVVLNGTVPSRGRRNTGGNMVVALPSPAGGKDPSRYDYIPEKVVHGVDRELSALFCMDLFRYLYGRLQQGKNIQDAAWDYIFENDLDGMISQEAIVKKYYRYRRVLFSKK